MYKELRDYFPTAITGEGLFSEIFSISNFPNVDPADVDTYFMLKHGDKLGSKVLENFTDDNDEVTGDGLKNLARVIYNTYINNWEHEYKTLTVEYNPIENTDYVETYKGNAHAEGNSTSTPSGTINTDTDLYGFNSSSAVHDGKSKTSYTNYKTEGEFENDANDGHEIRKHGNIGVTTNADMITSDLRAWQLTTFFDILCKDVCKVIALSIF